MRSLAEALTRSEVDDLAWEFLQQDVPCRQQVQAAAQMLLQVLAAEGFEVSLATDQAFVVTDSGYALRSTLKVVDPVGTTSAAAVQIELGLEEKGSLQDSVVLRLVVTSVVVAPTWADRRNHVDLVASLPVTGWAERRDCVPLLTEQFSQALARMGAVVDEDTARRYAMLLTQLFQP